MINELEYAGAEHLADQFVERFDRKQGFPDSTADIAVFQSHGVTQEGIVLDFGAGSGQFTIPAAHKFKTVVGIDVSPVMTKHLNQRVEALGSRNIKTVTAGFLTYAHDGDPVDGIYTRHALHQLPDFWKALALQRMHTLLKVGGVLRVRDLIYDFEPAEADSVFAEWFDRAADDELIGYTARDYAEHIRNEFSTFRWLFEPMLEHAGFEIVDCSFEARLYGSYTCLNKEVSNQWRRP